MIYGTNRIEENGNIPELKLVESFQYAFQLSQEITFRASNIFIHIEEKSK